METQADKKGTGWLVGLGLLIILVPEFMLSFRIYFRILNIPFLAWLCHMLYLHTGGLVWEVRADFGLNLSPVVSVIAKHKLSLPCFYSQVS